ncbi:unnamed protein product [Lactuca saligna]|uniref:PPIase cyclophilin-type domain-containing protein n=1 Tax=Lactuca saligna TaxID=75948 RepID=A0AA35YWR2_LACSI|nr:unnamed protein product [Lactuca saligna]
MEKIWQNSSLLHSTSKHHHHQPPPATTNTSPAVIKLSRRHLAICTNSSLLLLTSQFQPTARAQEQTLFPPENPQTLDDNPVDTTNTATTPADDNPLDTTTTTTPIEANSVETTTTASPVEENPVETSATATPVEENPVETSATTNVTEENQSETSITADETSSVTTKDVPDTNDSTTAATTVDSCTDKLPTKRAFLDISIDGKPVGRVVIGLYGNSVPTGTTRFSDFVSGAAGVSYRRKEFIKITPSYIQHGGVRSYGVDAELAAKTGRSFAVNNLVSELEKENGKCPGTKNVAGTVGIIVRDPLKPPPKQKLVARNGKLVIDEEEIGKEPNGTEFLISTKDSPELDASTLVVGKVLEGMEVVEKMSQVKTVQENTSSPYFRVAKLIGDKRAVVAERGFNRPYSKVIVTNCGLMA